MRLASAIPSPARSTLQCALLGLFLSSCGGSDAPTGPAQVVDRTPIRVIAGGGQTDSVRTTFTQALIVEVRDTSGKLSVGRTVRFTAIAPAPGSSAVVSVSALDSPQFGTFSAAVTDAQGRAAALVRSGVFPADRSGHRYPWPLV
jgi:hypothetical protein